LPVLDASEESIAKDDSLKMYPNPVADYLTLDFGFTYHSSPIIVEVISLGGKVVYTEEITDVTNGGKHTLPLSSLDRGMYLIRFDHKVIKGKIIKQ
jgi:hypothetical protein